MRGSEPPSISTENPGFGEAHSTSTLPLANETAAVPPIRLNVIVSATRGLGVGGIGVGGWGVGGTGVGGWGVGGIAVAGIGVGETALVGTGVG